MRLDTDEWQIKVADHLRWIHAYAYSCDVHAQSLMAMPQWETKAADMIARCERTLQDALIRIDHARREMESKPDAA
jgi:hypothetical protein